MRQRRDHADVREIDRVRPIPNHREGPRRTPAGFLQRHQTVNEQDARHAVSHQAAATTQVDVEREQARDPGDTQTKCQPAGDGVPSVRLGSPQGQAHQRAGDELQRQQRADEPGFGTFENGQTGEQRITFPAAASTRQAPRKNTSRRPATTLDPAKANSAAARAKTSGEDGLPSPD